MSFELVDGTGVLNTVERGRLFQSLGAMTAKYLPYCRLLEIVCVASP